jgi:hypothetical protein
LSNKEDLSKWINNTLSNLPIKNKEFFSKLWTKKGLSYYGSFGQIDKTDEYNSKLICYGLDQNRIILIVLPDDKPHRGAMLFSPALLRCAINQIAQKDMANTILYYGTSAGFKNSLTNTSINGVYLDSVFNSTYLSGNYKKGQRGEDVVSEYLPKVVCIYHPVHPVQFIQIYKPDWIAIDCSKENEIEWLNDLLTYCNKKALPVIAWCQNNFSHIIKEFENHKGIVFYSVPQNSDSTTVAKFSNDNNRILTPVVFEGEDIVEIDELFKKAKLILRNTKIQVEMRIKSDAMKSTWKYLRTLEKLVIPLVVYNQESKAFWRTYSLMEIKEGVQRYITLIEQYDHKLASELNECFKTLNYIYDKLEKEDPPYWHALSNYCIDRSAEGVLRVIIFPSRTQKQLFSYTLLSKCNISESELLDDSKIILRTIKWIGDLNDEDKELIIGFQSVNPIFIGLPEHYNNSFFYQSLNKFDTSILIFPHQLGTLISILRQYNSKDQDQFNESVRTLEVMTGIRNNIETGIFSDRYLLKENFKKLTLIRGRNSKVAETDFNDAIKIGDLHSELASLLENEQEEDTGYLVSVSINKDQKNETESSDSFLVENSIRLAFEDNHFLVVDPNDELNLIRDKQIVRIYARAVKAGNLILVIQNQVRKDLFDLLIERINDHKSLSVHLGLLQKWREEFYLGYMIWKDQSKGNNLQEFWQLLRDKGSDVVSPLTIANWLYGYTLRPQDSMNIERVGQILNNSFIQNHRQEIANAASRIVGLHISLSSKLRKWLDGANYDPRNDDMTIVDKELNLTLGELRGSMKILKVISSEVLREPALRTSLGILQSRNKN